MANPARISMFLRIVGGNVAMPYLDNPDHDERKIAAHTIVSALQMWINGEVTKADIINHYNLTNADDDGDLQSLKNWHDDAQAAKREKLLNILEWRLILARDKRTTTGVADLDGSFGYAVLSTFVSGADGLHSLRSDSGIPQAQRFNTWA